MSEERDNNWSKLGWGIMALLGTATLGGFSSAVVMYGNQQAQNQRLLNIEATLSEIKIGLADGTRFRYTSEQAASDRAIIHNEVNSMRDAWSKSFAAIIDQQTAMQTRMSANEQTIARLLERSGSKTP